MTDDIPTLRRPQTHAERYFVERRQDPSYERAYQRAWRGLDPELRAWQHPVRRFLQWIV